MVIGRTRKGKCKAKPRGLAVKQSLWLQTVVFVIRKYLTELTMSHPNMKPIMAARMRYIMAFPPFVERTSSCSTFRNINVISAKEIVNAAKGRNPQINNKLNQYLK